MKKWLKQDWLVLLILIAPFIIIAYFWSRFPDQLPTHYNINGEADKYGSKLKALLFGPITNIIIYALFYFLPKIDPKRANYALFQERYRVIRTILHVFIFGMFLITVLTGLGYNVNVNLVMPNAIILLLLVLGNYMGTIRHNYFLGVKTPWTLANEEVWRVTHRFTGRLWVIASAVTIVINSLLGFNFIVFAVYLALITAAPIIYSYLQFKRLQNGTESK